MTRFANLLFVALAVLSFYSVSTDIVTYTVTFGPCVQNVTCPQGNPARFNGTFILNGTISPKLVLNVGDRLTFNLATDVPIHPLTICRNSPIPKFCQGSNGTDELNIPITHAGDTTSVTFTTAGSYFYGCNFHTGMGSFINVTNPSSSKKHQGIRHKLFPLA
ncbi:hypothetical protein I4U23_003887 [Adineta vaga]|nr:hypothetical protein I4U23_003887 [Adineta vaga]